MRKRLWFLLRFSACVIVLCISMVTLFFPVFWLLTGKSLMGILADFFVPDILEY